jgi:heme exporter protein C
MAAGVKRVNVWWKLRGLAFVLVIALLRYGLILALKVSPPDAQQGNMGRAFY